MRFTNAEQAKSKCRYWCYVIVTAPPLTSNCQRPLKLKNPLFLAKSLLRMPYYAPMAEQVSKAQPVRRVV